MSDDVYWHGSNLRKITRGRTRLMVRLRMFCVAFVDRKRKVPEDRKESDRILFSASQHWLLMLWRPIVKDGRSVIAGSCPASGRYYAHSRSWLDVIIPNQHRSIINSDLCLAYNNHRKMQLNRKNKRISHSKQRVVLKIIKINQELINKRAIIINKNSMVLWLIKEPGYVLFLHFIALFTTFSIPDFFHV